MQSLLNILQSAPELKTVGTVEVLAQVGKTALQRHQLPAAVLLPQIETAEANRFIGVHVQSVAVKIELLLIETLDRLAKYGLAAKPQDDLHPVLIDRLLGTTVDGQALQYLGTDTVELLGTLAQGQLMRKITFGYTTYRKMAS